MIDRHSVYRKSAKGAESIANRQSGLTPKLRSVLIMVDGKRTYEDHARMASVVGDVDTLLGQLLSEGFIEVVQTLAVPAATAPTPAPAAPAPTAVAAAPVRTLKEAQRAASRRLNDLLGPSAESLCIRIEGAKTPEAYSAAVTRATDFLRSYGGDEMANRFAADMALNLPPG